jgi:hypothetical protein
MRRRVLGIIGFVTIFLIGMPILQPTLIAQANSTQEKASTMINGVMCHELNAEQAATLAENGVNWVSDDIDFNQSASNWNTAYTLAQQNHLQVLGIVDQWTMNFNRTFSITDWENAVTEAVTTYGNGISAWEIWNEPCFSSNYFGVFNGTAAQYVELMSTAYPIIKSAYPNATVLGLGGLPLYTSTEGPANTTLVQYPSGYKWVDYSENFTQTVVNLGGMNYCDAIALHAYPYGKYAAKYAGNAYVSSLKNYIKTTGKDVWITETGQYSEPYNGIAYGIAYSPQEQANYLSSSYALLKSQHVKAYFWYELNDNNVANNLYDSSTTSFGLYDFYSNPKPALGKYFSLVSQTTEPEFTPWVILSLVSVVILLSIVFVRKRINAPFKHGKKHNSLKVVENKEG